VRSGPARARLLLKDTEQGRVGRQRVMIGRHGLRPRPGAGLMSSCSRTALARRSHQHPAICSSGGRVGSGDRLDPAPVRHPLAAQDQGSLIYKRTGNLRAVQILLGHRKIESTVRYLGVDLEDALALSEGTDV
jgi:site-specific recombinase XerC